MNIHECLLREYLSRGLELQLSPKGQQLLGGWRYRMRTPTVTLGTWKEARQVSILSYIEGEPTTFAELVTGNETGIEADIQYLLQEGYLHFAQEGTVRGPHRVNAYAPFHVVPGWYLGGGNAQRTG